MSDPGLTKHDAESSSVLYNSARLTINLITNILICLTVFVCIIYVCSSKVLTLFHWHIILCVLGYQFLMTQGTLVLSRYNSWSMYMSRAHRLHVHIAIQLIGFLLIFVGTWMIVSEKNTHFVTILGSLGLYAVITSIISIINGVSANFAYKFSRSYIQCIKYIHYLSGILTLFLSTASLTEGFLGRSFVFWAGNRDAVDVLVYLTWLFTILVALEFWLVTGNRLRSLFK